jgi:hypothetical protein
MSACVNRVAEFSCEWPSFNRELMRFLPDIPRGFAATFNQPQLWIKIGITRQAKYSFTVGPVLGMQYHGFLPWAG